MLRRLARQPGAGNSLMARQGAVAPAQVAEQPSPPQWFVVRIQPKTDGSATRELAQDGFQVFSPHITTPPYHKGMGESPLFPGYLFLQCPPEMAGRLTFRPGHRVAGWVNFGGVIPPVPQEVVAGLMQRVEQINRDGGLWRRFKAGETVNVITGGVDTLAEVVAEAKSPEGRVKVLLSFMGRMVEAQVPHHSLSPAEGAPATAHPLPRRTRGRGRWIHRL